MLFLPVAPSLSLQNLSSIDSRRSGAGIGLWISVSSPHSSHSTPLHPTPTAVADIQNKANFSFHQPGLFIGFWAASSRTPIIHCNTTTSCAFFTHSFTSTQWKFPKATWNVMSRLWSLVEGVLVHSVFHTSLSFNFKYRVLSIDIGIFLTIFKSFKWYQDQKVKELLL